MNNVYFACRACKNYIDAGYRWPMSTLFQNRWNDFSLAVAVEEVLAHKEYWEGESANPYLAKALPAARQFLQAHSAHDLVFGDAESFKNFDDPTHSYLQWLDEGSLDEPPKSSIYLEPRYFAEHQAFRYTSWKQVEDQCALHSCGWTSDTKATETARRVFLSAAQIQSEA